MAKFIVLGAGTFGGKVAETLFQRKHEVLVVDKDKEQVQRVKTTCTEAMVGDATERSTLEELPVQEASAVVVSLGESMEPSILATHYLKELKARRIVVKILNEVHGRILHAIGATDLVFPERDSAVALGNQLSAPNLLSYLPLSMGFTVEEMAPPPAFIGKTLRELKLRTKFGVQVVAIREIIPDRMNLVPDPDAVVKESDTMIVIGKKEDLDRLRAAFRVNE